MATYLWYSLSTEEVSMLLPILRPVMELLVVASYPAFGRAVITVILATWRKATVMFPRITVDLCTHLSMNRLVKLLLYQQCVAMTWVRKETMNCLYLFGGMIVKPLEELINNRGKNTGWERQDRQAPLWRLQCLSLKTPSHLKNVTSDLMWRPLNSWIHISQWHSSDSEDSVIQTPPVCCTLLSGVVWVQTQQ